MRVFLRTETGEVITIQTADTTTVRELKQAALDSGRSQLPLQHSILFDGHTPVKDENKCVSALRKPVAGTPNTWLWLAERADLPASEGGGGADSTATASCVQEATPAPNEEGVEVGASLSLLLPHNAHNAEECTVNRIHSAITLRGPCDTLVPTSISAAWPAHPSEKQVLKVIISPEFPLDPVTPYTVAINSTLLFGRGNGLASYIASFTTGSCLPVRIMLRERAALPGDTPNSKKLLTLTRSSGGLFGELLTAIANRTGCAVQRVGRIVATQTRRKDSRIGGGISRSPTWEINSSSGCLKLSTGDLVEFEQLSEADAAPTIVRNEATALQTREEYVKVNYVNEESGYYCVVGKMTPEEEGKAVLKLYELVSGSDSEMMALPQASVGGGGTSATSASNPTPTPPILQELLDGRVSLPSEDGSTGRVSEQYSSRERERAMVGMTSSNIPAALVDNPWLDPSNLPTVYSLSDLYAAAAQVEIASNGTSTSEQQQYEKCDSLLSTWRLHGYFFVCLEDDSNEAPKSCVASAFHLANAIFGLPSEMKATLTDAEEVYLGYQDRTLEFEKELFQIRESRGHEEFWQRVSASTSAAAAAAAAAATSTSAASRCRGPLFALRSLSNIAHAATKVALSAVVANVATPEQACANASFADALHEPVGGPGEHRQVSESNITLFRYTPKAHTDSMTTVSGGKDLSRKKRKMSGETSPMPTTKPQCPYHTDVGLVTIIPRCHKGAGGGLRILDYTTMRWIDFEATGCPPDVAIVFGGESLAHITDNLMMPAVHDVLVKPGEMRTSVVYQHLGARNTQIPSFGAGHGNGSADVGSGSGGGGGGGGVGGGGANVASKASTIGELVRAISASRRSSNFPAELVAARRQGTYYLP